MPKRGFAAALVLVATSALACSNTLVTSSRGGLPRSHPERPVVLQFSGAMSIGPLPREPVAADRAKSPIVIGLINQENVDLGSYPEVRQGVEGAVAFINAELGGVDGHPLVLRSCRANFTPERSQSCAQQMVEHHALAVLGGLDIMSTASVPVLAKNRTPYVGGIPINLDEMRNPYSFQFSGGSPGAFAAFAQYAATTLHAHKVAVAYGDYPPIKTAAVDYGVRTLHTLGVTDVREVPFPIVTSDYAPIVAKANEGNPDAIFVSATDKACVDVMKQQKHYKARLFLVGACASPSVLEAVGPAGSDNVIFNVEGPIRPTEAGNDTAIYNAAMARYAPKAPPASAATVSFRAAMDLWSLMVEVGAARLNSASLVRALRSTRDHPSFMGHAFTCDGKAIPALPSLCSPQQILVIAHHGELAQLSEWIDVPELVRRNGRGG